MTPRVAEVLDKWPDIASRVLPLIDSAVCFDMSRVSDLVLEMADQNSNPLYPLFLAMPAPSVCVEIEGCAILCRLEGEKITVSAFDDVFSIVAGAWTKGRAEGMVQECLKSGKVPPQDICNIAFKAKEERILPDAVVYPGELTGERSDLGGFDLAVAASSALELIAQQVLFECRDASLPRHTRRRLERSGAVVHKHKVVDFCRSHTSGTASSDDPSFRKALHFVAGHWRRSSGPKSRLIEGERKTWIDGHWRGNPDLGIVTKSYVAGNKFLKARGRAA